MYQVLIVDDEPFARQLIRSHLASMEGIEITAECGNAMEACHVLRTRPIDLILLDIQMPEINGLQMIRSLRSVPSVIITTAYRDYAPEAFDVDAIDYVLKPIAPERLMKAMNKFFEQQAQHHPLQSQPVSETVIHVKCDRTIHKIAVNEIRYIESLDEYVKLHLSNQVLITRESITSFEQRLQNMGFVRIHRSYLVPSRHVQSVSADGVRVHGLLLPFGRAFKMSALAALGIQFK